MSTLSYVSGASEKPLIGLTLGQQFDAACAQYAERDALVSHAQGIRLTYAQLQQQVNQVACALLRLRLFFHRVLSRAVRPVSYAPMARIHTIGETFVTVYPAAAA